MLHKSRTKRNWLIRFINSDAAVVLVFVFAFVIILAHGLVAVRNDQQRAENRELQRQADIVQAEHDRLMETGEGFLTQEPLTIYEED